MLKEKPPLMQYWPKNAKYLMCIDESGDRNLARANSQWPILSICGVLLDLTSFDKVKRTFISLKCALWPPNGLDKSGRRVCFHSRDMRRKTGPFSENVLTDEKRALMDQIIWQGVFGDQGLTMKIFSAIIDKPRLSLQYYWPEDPYNLAVTFILERIVYNAKGTAVLFESRGRSEDQNLYDHIKRLFTYGSRFVTADEFSRAIVDIGFHPKFDSKGKVVCGLELADLAAYALGSWYVRRTPTPYSTAVLPRLHGFKADCPSNIYGKGLKLFPDLNENQRRTLFEVRL
ncbi:MAG TPA: DUF3800 domain-containing protein [Firmicutes bacterium]|nr:DUF3800 domain-containing protein [Candidatus Fermentithermobacillaceae bacterium]